VTTGWVELRWIVPRKRVELLSLRLFELGSCGIQEDFLPGEAPPPRQPWDRGAPPPPPERVQLIAWWREDQEKELREALVSDGEFSALEVTSWLPCRPEDWGGDWKANFHRHVLSDRLAVAPPWEAREGDLVIEPGLAFGTGEHPTTLSCLAAIARWAIPGERCLDVGCGSGILALAAAKLGMDATGIDIEEDAVLAANENARRNALEARFSSCPIAEHEGRYDLVVANLYAEALSALSSDILRLSVGYLALAGILSDREELVHSAFSSAQLVERRQEGEWVALWYRV
jgi:ribosomal protein L11 methyltransferase